MCFILSGLGALEHPRPLLILANPRKGSFIKNSQRGTSPLYPVSPIPPQGSAEITPKGY